MDIHTVARQASRFGLMPCICLKDALVDSAVAPLLPVSMSTPTTITRPAFLQALLYESALFLLRSVSQLVSYEAATERDQSSWATVTLYYANYYAALSMNRLAGEALSTVQLSGRTYSVKLVNASTFDVERTERNNHKDIWTANFRLYETFNWRDSTLDGLVIKVPETRRFDHHERKGREKINYHPEGYKEMLASQKERRWMKSLHGRYYTQAPNTFLTLPFTDEFEKFVALLECCTVSRQLLLLALFEEIVNELKTSYPSSRITLVEMFDLFSRHHLTKSPFTNRNLKTIYHTAFAKILK